MAKLSEKYLCPKWILDHRGRGSAVRPAKSDLNRNGELKGPPAGFEACCECEACGAPLSIGQTGFVCSRSGCRSPIVSQAGLYSRVAAIEQALRESRETAPAGVAKTLELLKKHGRAWVVNRLCRVIYWRVFRDCRQFDKSDQKV